MSTPGSDDRETKKLAAAKTSFPDYPGGNFLAHAGSQYKEDIDARLSMLGLLGVAQGGDSPAVKAIIDTDLSMLPELPTTLKDYYRNLETRLKIQTQNAQNEEKRFSLRMSDWTTVYSLFKMSTEKSAPLLSRDLLELCDMMKITADPKFTGCFDGPRAYKIVMKDLAKDRRSQADKEFYRAAIGLQLQQQLPDGCSADVYSQKALSFLVHIKPHLPQKYDDDDTSDYLIKLMPRALREGGRRITAELLAEGRYHDHSHVIARCRALVHDLS